MKGKNENNEIKPIKKGEPDGRAGGEAEVMRKSRGWAASGHTSKNKKSVGIRGF